MIHIDNTKLMDNKVNNIKNMFTLHNDIINGYALNNIGLNKKNMGYNTNHEIIPRFIEIDNDNEIILDYRIFKLIAMSETYTIIIETIMDIIERVLDKSNMFTIHVCLKTLTLKELDNHYTFICNISETLKNKYTDKLDKCYIYNAPFIFSHAISIVSKIVDKKTQQKIIVIK